MCNITSETIAKALEETKRSKISKKKLSSVRMDAIELHVKFNGKEYRDSIPMNRVRDIYGNALRNVRANGR